MSRSEAETAEGNDEGSDLRDRTKAFALRVIKMFTALPKTEEARVLGRQVLRSGTSVGANYRDSSGTRKPAESSPQGARGGVRQPQRGRSKPEFIAKIGDCLKELDETAYWLELLRNSARGQSPS